MSALRVHLLCDLTSVTSVDSLSAARHLLLFAENVGAIQSVTCFTLPHVLHSVRRALCGIGAAVEMADEPSQSAVNTLFITKLVSLLLDERSANNTWRSAIIVVTRSRQLVPVLSALTAHNVFAHTIAVVDIAHNQLVAHPIRRAVNQAIPWTNVAEKANARRVRSHSAYSMSPLLLPEPQPQSQPQPQQLVVPLSVPPSASADPFDAALFLYEIALRSRRPSECAVSPAARRFYYSTHLPVYHFERTAQSAQSSDGGLWVAVCSLDIRMAGQSDMSRLKRFKSTQRRTSREAKQEAATRTLEAAMWTAIYNGVVRQIKERRAAAYVEVDADEVAMAVCHNDIAATQNDSCAALDRLLAHFNQTAVVYRLHSTVVPNVRGGAKTMWKCAVELNLHFAGERNRPTTSITAAATRKTEAKAAVATESVRYIVNQLTCAQPISPPLANSSLNAFSNGLTSSLFAFQPQTHRREQ